MEQVTQKQQPMFSLCLKWNVPGVLSHLNKACNPNRKPGLNRRNNNFRETAFFYFILQKRDSSPTSFWHCNARKTSETYVLIHQN